MKLLPLLFLLLASPSWAGRVTASAFWYHSSTSIYARPSHGPTRLAGEFTASYAGTTRLAPFGSIGTMIGRDASSPFVVASTLYQCGLRWRLSEGVTLEASHGSWHNLDSVGRTELYNRIGLRARLAGP